MSPENRKGRSGKTALVSAPTKAPTRISYPKSPLPANGETVITIEAGPFGDGFDVTVRPTPEGENPDAHFETYKQARGWAGGLRLCHCWRIVDHVGDMA